MLGPLVQIGHGAETGELPEVADQVRLVEKPAGHGNRRSMARKNSATTTVMTGPIHIARKHRFSKMLQWRMAGNLLIDWGVGGIPLLGDAFDVAFKANLKNLALLEKAAAKRRARV